MAFPIVFILFSSFAASVFLISKWTYALYLAVILGVFLLIALFDIFQNKHAIRKNFPLIGNLRYLFEKIRPELQQYFVESNHNGRPIPREFRSVVYQRAKGMPDTLPFGTQRDMLQENHEWVHHSLLPKEVDPEAMRVNIGGKQCLQPYSASLFNISAMSFGSISSNAIEALCIGAKKGNFYHNTGEGGVSKHHLKGGDLVWQIGTGYFGCRNEDGSFSDEKYIKSATLPEVKMIELKLSQGAKPGKGGLLPGQKVNQQISEARGIKVGETAVSPPSHRGIDSPKKLLEFIKKLRDLSGGKPTGFKICIGRRSEFYGICKAIKETGIYPDFITVDGAEGGTGAAPLEFSNSIGRPIDEGLSFAIDALRGFGLKKEIKVIASGKVFTSFHLLTKIALGADAVNSSRGMMLALGCIQALLCHTNKCPTGVATTDPKYIRGLDVTDKSLRVANYHKATIKAFTDIVGAMGYDSECLIQRGDIFRRQTDGVVKSYEDIFPTVAEGVLVDGHDQLPSHLHRAFKNSDTNSFFNEY